MPNIVLVGAQWGDEGKGKVIDILSKKSNYIVRFQGGNNAGHTIEVGKRRFILHLIPSGILHRGKICVIGNGVVVNPEAIFNEIEFLKREGIDVKGRLFISDRAHVIFPFHPEMDSIREEARAKRNKIGTTKRGIGPCYGDKIMRLGLRIADILDPAVFKVRLSYLLDEKNSLACGIYKRKKKFSFKVVFEEYTKYAKKLKPFIADTSLILSDAIKKGKSVLFEGAQGTLLDIDHGTYPFVTSSNATAGGAITGSGVGPANIDEVIGVVKAYTTRVGEGPMPTEFGPELMEHIRDKGGEFGATTGRPRRCGWFDAVVLKYAARINGLTQLAVTKLDVLDGMDEIKICVAYKVGNKIIDNFPANIRHLEEAKPVYEVHKGWKGNTKGSREYKKLPLGARKYLKRISELSGVPVGIISVGSNRNETIFV